MKITKRQLKRIIREEKAKLKEVEYWDDATDSAGHVQAHYAHDDIVLDIQEVLDRWMDVSPAQLRMALDDAIKGM